MTDTPNIRVNAMYQMAILRALISGPISTADIAKRAGCGEETARKYVGALRDEKLVRVCAWDKASNGAAIIPLMEWNPDVPDVVVRHMTSAERKVAIRAKARKERLAAMAVPPTSTPELPKIKTQWATLLDFLSVTPAPEKPPAKKKLRPCDQLELTL